MKQVCIITNKLDIGGVERSLLSLLHVLCDAGYQIDLWVLERGGALESLVPGAVRLQALPPVYQWLYIPRGRVLPSLGQAVRLGKGTAFLRALLQGLKTRNMEVARQRLQAAVWRVLPPFQKEYDIAIDYASRFKSLVLNKIKAGKKLTWVHGDYRTFDRDRTIDSEEYAAIDGIVHVSQGGLSVFSEIFPHAQSKCVLLPNITLKKNISAQARAFSAFEGDGFCGKRIVDISRLDANKGIEIAMAACKILAAKGHPVRWYIVGDGPLLEALNRKIRDEGLEKHFFLLGPQNNPYPYLDAADFIVHCSLTEGRSVAIDEAMLLDKPILLTDYPTAKDQIDHGVNGEICAIAPEAVAQAIERWLQDPAVPQRYRQALQAWDIPWQQSLALFEQITQTTDKRGASL